jgi:Kinesin motor domain
MQQHQNSKSQNILTYVRVRPFNAYEKKIEAISCLSIKENSVFITNQNETTVLSSDANKNSSNSPNLNSGPIK